MSLYSFIKRFSSNHPLLIYALVWTVLLTITVAISSLSPEIAFMSAISPTSSFSTQQQHNQGSCKIEEGYIRVPIDNPVVEKLPESDKKTRLFHSTSTYLFHKNAFLISASHIVDINCLTLQVTYCAMLCNCARILMCCDVP
ncbi:uncharacterized protein LOC113313796 [Papaver somniferum]|uniref:uncharacterized protein LOC113313796 n=1 Tax=Papaver somniferum TaxID=3469 RepID=UPI000E703A76|nr:uncharacterized protein LOC113313796 [Papaver somniferum]